MHGGDNDSPSNEDSGYDNYPPTQTWRSSPTPPPSQSWVPTSPLWQHTPQYRGQSSSHQRNMGRPQSAFGDYRPNMDAINHPRPDTPSHSFQHTQYPLSDYDRFTLEQMMGKMSSSLSETPPSRVDVPVPTRVGGRGGGVSCAGDSWGVGDVGGSSGGGRRSTHYTKVESVAVARDWDAVTSDAAVGTDQTELSFWSRVLVVYDDFKSRGATPREPDQIRKKWGRILKAVKRFAVIYENNHRTTESGRSKADVKALSFSMFNTEGFPKFGYWDELLFLRDCPKFCEEELAPRSKRNRLGRAGNYSSSSGSRSINLNDAGSDQPSATHSRRPRPQGQQSTIRDARATGSFRFSAAASGLR